VPENRWGVFVTGLGEFTGVGNTANAAGFDLRTGGVTLGVDHRIGSNFAIGLLGGYDWKRGGLTVGPTASFQYSWVGVDGFTEHGSLAPLRLDDQHAESKRTALGARAAYDWKVGRVLVRPEVRAAWQHEFGETQYAVASSFANGAGTGFSVTGPAVGHDSLLLGAGVAVLWSERLATYIYYDGEIGRANYESHNVSAGVRLTF
jgi:outer membrane autotransporter protein